MDTSFCFRPMQLADLEQVLVVEQAAYTHPWTRAMFVDSLESRYECWVAESHGELIGHTVLSIACGEAHILNICVKPDKQRQGIGRYIMNRLLLRAKAEQAEMVFLEVRASNESAQQLYLSMGFNQVGERKNYYRSHQGRENAIIFALHIIND
jgi:[ribosomal protein S18]-alanine N-acetyltransferase